MRAVDGVSFDVDAGETLALVGESGCGKSTTGRAILRLIEPTSGTVHVRRAATCSRSARATCAACAGKMQIVFQDPFSSLNPRMSIGAIVREGLTIHKLAEGAAADARVKQLLEEVGLRARVREPRTRTSSPAGSGSASASRARCRWSRSSSCATSR